MDFVCIVQRSFASNNGWTYRDFKVWFRFIASNREVKTIAVSVQSLAKQKGNFYRWGWIDGEVYSWTTLRRQ